MRSLPTHIRRTVRQLLPLHEMGEDSVRHELDELFGREVLGLPKALFASGAHLNCCA